MKLFQLFILFFFLVSAKGFAQEKIESDFTTDGDKILITYQLDGDSGDEYQVKAELKRKNDPNFSLIPAALSGDVGVGKFAGGKRTIIWIPNDKELPLIEGEDFYFEVTAKSLKPSGGSGWLYWAGGILLAGGGTFAVLKLLKKDDTANTINGGGNTTQEIPLPPARP